MEQQMASLFRTGNHFPRLLWMDPSESLNLKGRGFSKRPLVGEIERTHGIFRSRKDGDLDAFPEVVFFNSLCENHGGNRFAILLNQALQFLDQHSGGFLLEGASILVDEDDAVHIVSFEHFFNDEGIELELKQIPEAQGILQADDMGP